MKKGDLMIAVIGLIIMLGFFLGYRYYISQAGDDRMVVVRYEGNAIYDIELTDETNIELLIIHGKVIEEIDRNQNPDQKFNLENKEHYNIIRIYNQGIQVIEADCENQDDVRKGFTKRPFDVILCIPHHLEVEVIALDIEINTDLDGTVG